MGAGNGAQANFLMGEPAFRSLVPQVRVPTLDANLGSLTLTTGITSSLDPAIYNACGWVGGPGYHPLRRPQVLPHERSSCAWVGTRPTLARCRMGWVSLKSASLVPQVRVPTLDAN